MKKYTVLAMAMFIAGFMMTAGCSKKGDAGVAGAPGAPGEDAPVPAPTPVDSEQAKIDAILADENEYRLGLGQTELSRGLGCTLYTTTGGDRIQASIAGHNTLTGLSSVATFLLNGVIDQPDSPTSSGMNVLPEALRASYTNMYMLRCQGQIVVAETGWQLFELASDDASVLYFNGSKLIDNDNNHGVTTVVGSKYMRKGVYAFRLDYAQTGGGNQALVLKLNGSLINPALLAH